MKKLVILSLLLISGQLFSASWTPIHDNAPGPAKVDLLSSNLVSSTFSVNIDGFYLEDVNTGQGISKAVRLGGTTPLLRQGCPELPKLAVSLIIPDQGQSEIKVISSQYIDYQNIDIAPSKGNLSRDQDPGSVPFQYGPVYQRNEFFPSTLTNLPDPFIMRDFRGQTVIVYPLQYNPATHTLRVYYQMTLELTRANAVGKNEKTATKALHQLHKEYQDIYSHQFLNFKSSKYTPVDEEGSMLVICPDNFNAAIQPLINWKISKGIPVEVVNAATLGNSQGIKTYITNYYNEHDLAYVLLVGDHQQVPSYMATAGASDNTYTYVAGTDHYSDLFIGRFSATTAEQVTVQVNKVLYYEINPDVSTNWFETCIGIASSQGPGDDNEMDYEHIRNLQTQLDPYTYNTFSENFDGSQGGLDPSGDPTPAQISTAVNNGASLILYCGHGSQTSWSSSGFSNTNVTALTNYGKLPFIWSVACVNGDFTNGTCFAEAWMRASQNDQLTGAIATLMSTINQSWDPPMEGEDEMVSILTESYSNNIKRTFGGLSLNGCAKMIDSYGSGGESMADTWNLFGDPSVVVRTAMPQTITATHNPVIYLGSNQFQVNCPINGVLACISLNNNILGTTTTNGGTFIITLSDPLTVIDTITLVISGYNYIPYVAQIPIMPATGPYVSYVTNLVHDPSGNNNGQPDYDETVTLDITLQNLGISVANNVTASLSTTNPHITILDNNQSFGDINNGTTGTQNDAFSFAISDSVPDQQLVNFDLNIVCSNGGSWTTGFTMLMDAPAFAMGNIYQSEVTGNGNGNLDPGENVDIMIPTLNIGQSDAQATTGTLSTTSPDITINTGTVTWPGFIAGGTNTAAFNITVSNTATTGTLVEFQYNVTSGDYQLQRTFYRTIGIVDEDFETGNLTQFPWQNSSVPWTVSGVSPYEGMYCAKSGAIGNNSNTNLFLTLEVIAEDSISFYRKVSSEQDYDFLHFYVDNTQLEEWSGEQDWARVVFPITTGTHTFKWSYTKDVYQIGGSDAAWIDYIVFPPVSLPMSVQSIEKQGQPTLLVYPNPASDHLVLSYTLPVSTRVELKILDATGKMVASPLPDKIQTAGMYSIEYQTTDLNPGIYFIQLNTPAGTIHQKLVVIR